MLGVFMKFYNAFKMLKGFDAGYTSENEDSMVIKVNNMNYKVTFEKLGEGEVKDHIDKLKKGVIL